MDELPDDYALLDAVRSFAQDYLAPSDRLVYDVSQQASLAELGGPLPRAGRGGPAVMETLLALADRSSTRSTSTRFFHLVIGGVTPTALAADWMTSALDQNPGMWLASPLGTEIEVVAKQWLLELLDLPAQWEGTLTSGATMANFTCLAAARQWAGGDRDVAADGLDCLPSVLASPNVHASVLKALSMLGLGRNQVVRLASAPDGRLDLSDLAGRLREQFDRPVIVLATAGEPNTAAFDPIDEMATLVAQHQAWLHVDGAFGVFARAARRSAHLAAGLDRADSVAFDVHKWLNVPYDSGAAFVARSGLLEQVFGGTPAGYFRDNPAGRPNLSMTGPEMSRRARGFTLWASLAAMGRSGIADMVNRHISTARHFTDLVKEHDDFELLEEPELNIVCCRYRPAGRTEEQLDDLNAALAEELFRDGRVYVGTTRYRDKIAFRPAFINWRTSEHDADFLMTTMVDVAARLLVQRRHS